MTPIFIGAECRPRAPRKRARRRGRHRRARVGRRADFGPGPRSRPRGRDRRGRSSRASTVSTHSVVSRSVMHGTPSRYASFWTPAGVREHRPCVTRQLQEVQIAERRREPHVRGSSRRSIQSGGLEPRRRPGMHGETTVRASPRGAPPAARAARACRRCRPGVRSARGTRRAPAPSRSRIEERSSAMSRKASETSAITSPTRCTSPATLSRSRFATAVSVEHSSSSLAWSVRTRFSSSGISRSKERMPASTWPAGIPAWRAAMAPASVELVSPYTSTMLGSNSREHRLEGGQDARGLRRVGAATGVQLTRGRRDAELLEEDLRELVVVVLPGVDDHLIGDLAQPARDRGRLDELRAVADDRDDQPAASSSSMRCRSAAATSRVRSPSGSSRSSICAIDCASRVVEARNASRGRAQVVHRARPLDHVGDLASRGRG